MSNPDPAWSLGNDDDFVLEDDENFGVGDLEGGDLPPFDDSALAAPAVKPHRFQRSRAKTLSVSTRRPSCTRRCL